MGKIFYKNVTSAKAACMVNLCIEKGIKLNANKLENLMILFKCEMLANNNRHAFTENVEYRGGRLTLKSIQQDYQGRVEDFNEKLWELIHLYALEKHVMEGVIDRFGGLSSHQLESLKPMQQMLQHCKKKKIILVPESLICQLFAKESDSENEVK